MEKEIKVHWVVALRPEANAVIDRFQLSLDSDSSRLFPVYRSKEDNHSLVISGPGKVNAAAATAYLAALELDHPVEAGWINFGIAGSPNPEYGNAYLASKVSDEATTRSHFPPFLWNRKKAPERRQVLTVDQPCETYPNDGSLVEMEASGFFETVSRCQTAELCQCLKVVSDDPDHSILDISKNSAKELCDSALDQAGNWFEEFRDQIAEYNAIAGDPPGYREILERHHFSATRSLQLRRLLQQWQARSGDQRTSLDPDSFNDAKHCIESIRKKMWQETYNHKNLA